MISTLRCGKYQLDLTAPVVMGVLNVTPDSFSDGGQFNRVDKALAHARQMLMDGAKIVDVGGESTRPGAAAVSLQEEMDRVCPVVEALVAEHNALVSVDTSSPKLMAEAVRLGAGIVNYAKSTFTTLLPEVWLEAVSWLLVMTGFCCVLSKAEAVS
mgnify:CR=1 FL=1